MKKLSKNVVPITFNTTSRISRKLSDEAIRRGVTQTRLLHEGLRAIGFEISDDELLDRRGRPKKLTSNTANSSTANGSAKRLG